mmetsp:Transcript_4703/g.9844  ORF Transcript_4703/g.9844 Transcript_4703/m.9844 type:complete len:354 (-) Transcript_4703:66-1127(-)
MDRSVKAGSSAWTGCPMPLLRALPPKQAVKGLGVMLKNGKLRPFLSHLLGLWPDQEQVEKRDVMVSEGDVEENYRHVIDAFKQGVLDVHARSRENNWSLLHLAAAAGSVIATSVLVLGGANVEEVENLLCTPLFRAIENLQENTAVYLIEKGSDVNKANVRGDLPLHKAAELGLAKTCKALIERGADPLALDETGRTTLICAARSRREEVVKMMIEQGVDVNHRDKRGHTAMILLGVAAPSTVSLMLEAGADQSMCSTCQRRSTCLSVAVRYGLPSTIETLLDHSTSAMEMVDIWGRTPLMLAVMERKPQAGRILLRHGADANAKDVEGKTALALAVKENDVQMLRIILNGGK